MKEITLKELLEAGCHFGHQSNRWHPKAASYIYAERDGVHIIDLVKTKEGLEKAGQYLHDLAKSGGLVIFVGTKRQAKPIVEEGIAKVAEALGLTSGFHYLLERWPGGMLTNFDVMAKNLAKMKTLLDDADNQTLTKKERLLAKREHDKLDKYYGGIKTLAKLPNAVFLVDPKKEQGCVREAVRTGVKLVAICDSNCNPDPIDFQIPANDDAVGSVKIIVDYLVDCWIEGRQEYNKSESKRVEKEAKEAKEAEEKKEEVASN